MLLLFEIEAERGRRPLCTVGHDNPLSFVYGLRRRNIKGRAPDEALHPHFVHVNCGAAAGVGLPKLPSAPHFTVKSTNALRRGVGLEFCGYTAQMGGLSTWYAVSTGRSCPRAIAGAVT
jgi:hypothetical protein